MSESPIKFGISVLLGILAPFLILALFAGGIMNAFGTLFFLIICTGGVGLVIVIPVWLGAGTLIYKISMLMLNQKHKNNSSVDDSGNFKKLSNDQKALTEYIRQSRSKGVSDNDIFSLLKTNGWAENTIHEAFGLVATHKESSDGKS